MIDIRHIMSVDSLEDCSLENLKEMEEEERFNKLFDEEILRDEAIAEELGFIIKTPKQV
mgnify:CR=1 FL=1